MNRPQEFRIFHEGIKVELTTSKMGIIFVKIRFHFETCSKSKNGEDKQFK